MAARTVLICHDNEPLNREGLARWLGSFTDLACIIVIHEPPRRMRKRIRREIERIGWLRTFDMLAFRIYHRLRLARQDREWNAGTLRALESRYPPLPATTRILDTSSPNSKESEQLLRELQPDLIIARCKTILAERIFRQARTGTLVMHPGICPEYRNAHGCFWALARRDIEKVGMTLLQVDSGVDTGPVYGYFGCAYDERRETHNIIQSRVVFDNLDSLEAKFREILAGTAERIETGGRNSQAWGQPWLSAYLGWKRAAARQAPVPRKATALLYHDVVPGARHDLSGFQGGDANIYKLECAEFRRHMREIAERGACAQLVGQTPSPVRHSPGGANPVLLTFDDGGVSAALYAADILAEFGWPAHFFVTTGLIGRPGFLSTEQLRELRAAGHAIGSHSVSHPARMSHCSAAELAHEWGDSVRRLEDILGERVTTASVPGGYYSRKVGEAAAAAGVRFLFTSEPVMSIGQVDGCRIIGRFCVQQGVTAEWVASVLAGRLKPRLERYLSWNGKKLLKTVGGELWLTARRSILARRAA